MLQLLRIRHFAIIDKLEVELGPGLNVVTGETGAGKSILVDALELVLGGKGRPELVRTGETEAEVEALFDLADDPVARARLESTGLAAESELLVRRVVQASGKSRAYVNGRLATIAQLSALAEGLADISSQHQHHSLVDPKVHLSLLDAFAEVEDERGAVAAAYEALLDATRALEELRTRVRDRSEREDLLRFQLREIEELAPEEGEEAKLSAERDRLRHAERLATSAGRAEAALYADDGAVCDVLARLGAELEQAARFDGSFAEHVTRIEAARSQLEDVAMELGRYARDVAMDPDRLAQVDERLDRLGRMKRKYGGDLGAVLAHAERVRGELDELDHHDTKHDTLERAREAALTAASGTARVLRDKRVAAASRLGDAISRELGSLGMGDARVVVEVAPLDGRDGELVVDGARLSASGIDRAEFLIAPNRGEEARPLRKIASGGELSRAMLAVKRVLAGLGPSGLYVFDEVDSGIGGGVAEVIGQKLRDVARHHQVICITHLPQIAVYADAHFFVSKDVVKGRTRSEIRRLAPDERLEETARMLGGLRITAQTRAAAAEMMAGAERP